MRRMVCAARISWCVFKRYRIWFDMVDEDARLHEEVYPGKILDSKGWLHYCCTTASTPLILLGWFLASGLRTDQSSVIG
uniref:Uncharacterized protein n=1 Tax=Salix viminalis TaxID=40686 RepID=A0A6N2LZD3_SALVM